MRILYIIESLSSGGKERRLVELMKGLLKDTDAEVEIIITKPLIHYKEVYDLPVRIHVVKRKYFKQDPTLFYKIFRIARRFRPDIIHAWGGMVAIYAIPAKVFLHIPMINNQIVDIRVEKDPFYRDARISFYFSDRVIGNTHLGVESYNAPKEKSTVIYNGFNFDRLRDLDLKDNRLQEIADRPEKKILMVASLTNRKDYDTFVKAGLRILNDRNDVLFLSAGRGDASVYENMIAEEYKENFLFLGNIDHVEALMNVVDIGVLFSNTKNHGEGISNALMEFMSLGKPVIATRFGGNLELIEEGQTGFLVKPADETEAAEKMILLLDDPNLREVIGQRCMGVVREKFGIDKMIRLFREEYDQVLSPSGSLQK